MVTKLNKQVVYKENIILSSLYKSASQKKIPANIIVEFARVYGFQVDFQRDIRKKDSFQVMYEVFIDDNKRIIETGNILFANLKLTGQDNSLYYFDKKGSEGHYDKNGRSVKKALMKTPINGARLSSRYGNRKHPILGYTKMHRGLDFAAPSGTPVFAAGDGIIEKAGWNGSYGKYIRIRHTGTYKTAYAHLSGFHKSVRIGKRVSQGKIIGYVGTTGRSTGPHLHYEVIKNNIQVNPMRIKLPAGKNISKGDINNYKNHVQKILNQKIALEKSNRNKKLAINNHNNPKILILN